MGDSGTTVTVQFSGNDSIKTDIQKNLESDLQKKYPDNNFKCLESNSVDASMGFSFLLKCLTAVAIAAVLMVLYVTIRFKKNRRSFGRCYGSRSPLPRCCNDLLYVCNLPDAD